MQSISSPPVHLAHPPFNSPTPDCPDKASARGYYFILGSSAVDADNPLAQTAMTPLPKRMDNVPVYPITICVSLKEQDLDWAVSEETPRPTMHGVSQQLIHHSWEAD